ncbi:serine phosphatase RsbU (regulator of sigma subunit) [Streptomyces sp. Amel2xB2]|uniref:PP2C family protein-serine/threonine phosphatase n=1 Tax=Streptomyces sp. Amel2xB2 TaxID=1305829 RepID=UPI000DBF81B5|nr:SpoIIE family protein phosphatase [Streptomyces sp. Amel2xB2]RAJ70369.1 serine phosphatase RsbU (regulator of sigma subunit) [Streptomyces sp. Amel2xB2]
MTGSEIDYAALFAELPSPNLLLDPELTIVDANRAYQRATGRSRDDIVGQYLFDAFPANPADPQADGVQNLHASLLRVLELGRTDTMALQRYDIPDVGRPGSFQERWWSPVNTPVMGHDGTVRLIIHRVEDVTGFVKARSPLGVPDGPNALHEQNTEAELYVRAQELQKVNEELRRAHARESQVALTLQEAMLYSPDLPRPGVAVRYLPAVGTLNVCGDWYDVTDAPGSGFSAAVGDVVGHGLEAAGVMGMLRSALSAAMRATDRPAHALQILGLYANSVEGAQSATAVKVRVHTDEQVLAYSSAGHLPPVLLHAEGDCELLDQATDPPLATRGESGTRPEARTPYRPGDCLVLYTDGLIERRDEDIDEGIARLTSALAFSGGRDAEQVADEVLARLGVSEGARDDIALVVINL